MLYQAKLVTSSIRVKSIEGHTRFLSTYIYLPFPFSCIKRLVSDLFSYCVVVHKELVSSILLTRAGRVLYIHVLQSKTKNQRIAQKIVVPAKKDH